MEKNFKRGLIDGYFKVFDAFGFQSIGSNKYSDFDLENYKSYYRGMSLMMGFMFFTILISLVTAVISIIYGNLVLTYIMIGLYILTMCPLYYTLILEGIGYVKTYLESKK